MQKKNRNSIARRGLLVVAAFAAAAAAPRESAGTSTGIAGESGKQGTTCNQSRCHGDGTGPLVRFEGPASVAVGEVATFVFFVKSQSASQTHAGLNVAASAGTLAVVAGQGERPLGGELTHTTPKQNDGAGVASFEFTWRAPAAVGPQTLFGAGNSVNRNFSQTGDRASSTTLVVEVVGAATPTPSPSPTAVATVCTGDCDDDGQVIVNEIVTGVNIALGTAAIDSCRVFDADADGQVAVNEIVAAVNAALSGCPR